MASPPSARLGARAGPANGVAERVERGGGRDGSGDEEPAGRPRTWAPARSCERGGHDERGREHAASPSQQVRAATGRSCGTLAEFVEGGATHGEHVPDLARTLELPARHVTTASASTSTRS